MGSNLKLRVILVSIIVMLCSFNSSASESSDYYFEADLLDGVHGVDLNFFEKVANEQAPGKYTVGITVNNHFTGRRAIDFKLDENEKSIEPCFTSHFFKTLNLNSETAKNIELIDNGSCASLLSIIPYSTFDFSASKQELKISIPQKYIDYKARGYIPESEWDSGINTLFTNYKFSGDKSRNNEFGNGQNYFLSAQTGVNLGSWRLRNSSTWQNIDGKNIFDSQETYLQRDFANYNSQLRIGDAYTSGNIFDSIRLIGVNIRNETRMLADSKQSYAPTIQGIAKGNNAKVIVKQNGNILYQTYVNAGPFSITDLYPSGNGELEVIIQEVDGSEQHFNQGYASVPMLQREGSFDYEINLGRYSDFKDLDVFQAQVAYGLSGELTTYSGFQATDGYRAVNLGLAFNLSNFGALSVDVTQASSDFGRYNVSQYDANTSGQSYRFLYSNNINAIGTNLQLVGYRYATEGFYSLRDYAQISGSDAQDLTGTIHEKSQTQATLSKSFKKFTFSLNMTDTRYWDSTLNNRNISATMNSQFKSASYNVSFSSIKTEYSDVDNMVFLSVSVPLSFGRSNAWLGYNANFAHDAINHQVSLNGNVLDNKIRYSVSQGYDGRSSDLNGSANLSYNGKYTESRLAYSYDNSGSRVSYGLNGSVSYTERGVTLGQSMGQTNILVSIPGVEGVGFTNYPGVETDRNGNALINYSTPYRENNIEIDLNSLPDNIELDGNIQKSIPTSGALSNVIFTPSIGYKALFTLISDDGNAIPFGAAVTSGTLNVSAIVGDDNQVYISGLKHSDELLVRWGDKKNQQCHIDYQLPINTDDSINPRVFILKEKCTRYD